MAELPEIAKLSGQMRETLCGKTMKEITLIQEKCSNVSPCEFQSRIKGAAVNDVCYKGKWILTSLNNHETILLSLGMGADVLYFEDEKDEQEKFQIKVLFEDGTGYTARFWWFGKFLIELDDELSTEPNTKDIAIDPFNQRFTYEYFVSIMCGKKTQIKSFLMNQKNVGGIGNMYMHDILFKSGLHPQREISTMDENDFNALYQSIHDVLNLSREKGTFAYENDFFGQKGGFSSNDFMIGYKENEPCPVCGAKIMLIKTGGTSSFICPSCQKI